MADQGAASSSTLKSRPLDLTAKALRLTTPHPARHPNPTTKATALAYLIFDRPDLDLAAKFLTDFGLRVVTKSENQLYMRGTGSNPFCYVVNRAAKPRFVGLGLSVTSTDDLRKLAAVSGASNIENVDAPGGGRRIRLVDPAGFRVDAIADQTPADPLPHRSPIRFNAPDEIIRVDKTQRPPVHPPEVVKLGHVVLEVPNYQAVSAWYTQHFGFIPSDICVLPDGSPAVTFFRLDLGDKPADHHTLAMALSFQASYAHSAYEVVDADAVGMGQRVLYNRGWRHAWGIGRHILGSQIFDYWEDPFGAKHEHYCDGDVFTSKCPTEIHGVSRETMAQWGPLMPKSFTRPELGLKGLAALVRNLYSVEDLTIKKLITLIKLVA